MNNIIQISITYYIERLRLSKFVIVDVLDKSLHAHSMSSIERFIRIEEDKNGGCKLITILNHYK